MAFGPCPMHYHNKTKTAGRLQKQTRNEGVGLHSPLLQPMEQDHHPTSDSQRRAAVGGSRMPQADILAHRRDPLVACSCYPPPRCGRSSDEEPRDEPHTQATKVMGRSKRTRNTVFFLILWRFEWFSLPPLGLLEMMDSTHSTWRDMQPHACIIGR